MLKRSAIPLLLICVICLEGIIYLWAVLTTEPDFVFDKCARNSGRVSSLINLAILLTMGYYGFKEIYRDEKRKEAFRILVTLFAVNHLCHFFYVFKNFKSHAWNLSISENFHGFITIICILIVPVVLWTFSNLNKVFQALVTLHFFNASYFIMETFYGKIKPEHPAYHNQLGIIVTIGAMVYVVYRFLRETWESSSAEYR